ncbi:MAG: Short chain dehydrogenase [uncultured Campylobacterales bacterium]|uniref:Short chain dehydrogenase n=1 Tax=uncultured Campylobacterales bacterium TaxID=352960 RepID=A0A6S6TCE4_9BACT|nr:MAG: Short chain dehydrogenase [uncultured Campylobacterales bacterium]
MNEIKDLVAISRYAGERFDLVQAGGGNSSVKFESGEMVIKASGFLLSDVCDDTGYSKVYTKQISQIVKNKEVINTTIKKQREEITSKLVQDATIDTLNRPSIETLLHSFLSKYTLHTHPVVVNMIVIQKEFKTILKNIFKDDNIVLVNYQTPGIELALALDKELEKCSKTPNIIFLQNHGLIVTSDKVEEIKTLTEYVISKIENYLNIDMNKYKLTNNITSLLNSVKINSNISYLNDDQFLNEQIIKNRNLFFDTPFCPDSLVYCGVSSCEVDDLSSCESIREYKNKYFELPKVILYKNHLFFNAINIKKAKEIQEVFKFHIMVLSRNKDTENNFLSLNELAYLSNWEAEKYRQGI